MQERSISEGEQRERAILYRAELFKRIRQVRPSTLIGILEAVRGNRYAEGNLNGIVNAAGRLQDVLRILKCDPNSNIDFNLLEGLNILEIGCGHPLYTSNNIFNTRNPWTPIIAGIYGANSYGLDIGSNPYAHEISVQEVASTINIAPESFDPYYHIVGDAITLDIKDFNGVEFDYIGSQSLFDPSVLNRPDYEGLAVELGNRLVPVLKDNGIYISDHDVYNKRAGALNYMGTSRDVISAIASTQNNIQQ